MKKKSRWQPSPAGKAYGLTERDIFRISLYKTIKRLVYVVKLLWDYLCLFVVCALLITWFGPIGIAICVVIALNMAGFLLKYFWFKYIDPPMVRDYNLKTHQFEWRKIDESDYRMAQYQAKMEGKKKE